MNDSVDVPQLLYRSPDGEVMAYADMPRNTVRRGGDGSRVYINPEWSPGKSMTNQSEAPQADINNIVKRYYEGEPLPVIAEGQFMDVSEMTSYEQVQDRIAEMTALFMQYPAEVRERFGNNPMKFADFVVDSASETDLRQLGLFPEEEVKSPPGEKVEPVVPPEPPKA